MCRSQLLVMKLIFKFRRYHRRGIFHSRPCLDRDRAQFACQILPETHECNMQVGEHLCASSVTDLPAPAILQNCQTCQHRCQCRHGYPLKKALSGLWSGH